MDRVSSRGRRALALVGIAGAGILVAGAIYLRPHPPPAEPVIRLSVETIRPAVAPSRPAYVSFGDADHGAVTMFGRSKGTFVTADGGRTWTPRGTELSYVTFLDPDHVASVGLGPQGRFETSADAGRTWREGSRPVTSGFFSFRLDGTVTSGPYFVDSANGWWLDSRAPGTAPALWRTVDGGRTWDDVAPVGIAASGMPAPPQAPSEQPVFVDQLRGALVVSGRGPGSWPGVATTRDGGRTWRSVSVTWPPVPALGPPGGWSTSATLVARGVRLVLSVDLLADTSVRRWSSLSEDGGLTWAAWAALPAALSVQSAPVFDDAGHLLVADDRLLWTSTDLGGSWRSRPLPLAAGGRALAVIPAQRGALFVVVERGSGAGARAALLRSVDGGGHWAERPLPA